MSTNIDTQIAWRAFLDRDAAADGSFVTAVRSTGVYCKPSCAARRPKPENVTFFATPAEARAAGYRACLRCRPDDAVSASQRLVDEARRLIEDAAGEAVSLTDLSQELSVSPGHLQRTFKRLTGVSPRAYAEAQRLSRLKTELREASDVTAATYAAGFSSSSRLYERAAPLLGMTPGTYRRGGRGLTIGYAMTSTDLGCMLVATTSRGICFIALDDSEAGLEQTLRREFPAAELAPGTEEALAACQKVAALLHGDVSVFGLALDLRGSSFQLLVWAALQKIPRGETRSYAEIARSIGRAGSARAVGRACASNPVPLVVPCHRVVREDGGLGGYRWELKRKQALIELERESYAKEEAGS